jgi:large subunit ribosomal protein L6
MSEATSRIARQPVTIPSGVELQVEGQQIAVTGPKGSDQFTVHEAVTIACDDDNGQLRLSPRASDRQSNAMAGTMRSVVANMVHGVSQGFERKLLINGVGYRAQIQGDVLNLTLGFSHAVHYPIPADIEIECPKNTEVVVRGASKQRVGQVAAQIRKFRPPEPYKGKGVRYENEEIIMKEAKKK